MAQRDRTIILHAGRHKTGTSAIQHFLHENRARLKEAGYHYPQAGYLRKEPAHHGVALSLLPPSKSLPEAVARRVLRNFKREIEATDATIIASSEQFQNVSPLRLAQYLAGWKVKPVIYIRDHLQYLISSYQQVVHAKTLSMPLEEYRDRLFRVVYADMLDNWSACFGLENLTVAVYDKAGLRNGNVVEDFIWRITGQEASAFGNVAARDVNPSLGEPLLAFKRRINAYLPNEQEQLRMLYRPLSKLAARNPDWRAKPTLTPRFIAEVREKASVDTNRLAGSYFHNGAEVFAGDWPRIAETMDWRCDSAAIMEALENIAPAAAAYIRARVPADVLEAS